MTCVQNNYDRLKFVFGRDIILCGWLGSEYKLTNQLTNQVAISLSCFVYFTHIQPADALEDHEGTVSISFADDIDGLAEEEEELANLVERLDKASTAYGMEISAEKTKLMTNNTSGINTELKVNRQKLETVTSFKYQGSVIADEGSKTEMLFRIAQTTAALTRLKPVWNDRSISLSCLWIMDLHNIAAKKNTSKTTLPTWKSVPRSNRKSDNTKTSWPSERDANWGSMDMPPVH